MNASVHTAAESSGVRKSSNTVELNVAPQDNNYNCSNR
jgi:hypothetical protein